MTHNRNRRNPAREVTASFTGQADWLAKAIAPLTKAQADMLAKAIAPLTKAQADMLAKAVAPLTKAQADMLAKAVAPLTKAQADMLAKAVAATRPDPEILATIGQRVAPPRSLLDLARAEAWGERIISLPGLEGEPARTTPYPAERRPDVRPARPERAIPEAGKLKRHAPPELWEESREAARLRRAVDSRRDVNVVVMAADIRHSTILMKEAVDLYTFASILSEFMSTARQTVWGHTGWFDKFTGDGFLAYWPYDRATRRRVVSHVFETRSHLLADFREIYLPQFAANSQNFPNDAGFAIGLMTDRQNSSR